MIKDWLLYYLDWFLYMGMWGFIFVCLLTPLTLSCIFHPLWFCSYFITIPAVGATIDTYQDKRK